MLQYRALTVSEAERIAEIDATNFIKNVWRKDGSGVYQLTEINWTDRELPNGYAWHLRHFRNTLTNGGKAFGCFDGDMLVGYATVEGRVFGRQNYVLLDQLFVSKDYRGMGIGKALFSMCAAQGQKIGAAKLYLCAGSSENTMAFYHKLGCTAAAEPEQRLIAEDPRDIPLEYDLRKIENDFRNEKTDPA